MAAAMVKDGDVVGLGSGRAAVAFVRALGRRVKEEGLSCVAVATGTATEAVALEVGVPLIPLDQVEAFDIAVDGADEVDAHLNLLKGGGGNLLREKILESMAKKLVIVVGAEKVVDQIGMGAFPLFLEVVEFGRPAVVRVLEGKGATVTQRMNPDGSPFLTDDGNPYLHVTGLVTPTTDIAALDRWMHSIPGVVETGLFIGMASVGLIARVDGSFGTMTAGTTFEG